MALLKGYYFEGHNSVHVIVWNIMCDLPEMQSHECVCKFYIKIVKVCNSVVLGKKKTNNK